MRYDYKCNDCSTEEEWVVFEVSHGMSETPKIACPECKGCNCEKAHLTSPSSWTRGYGWLDVRGRRRDMNLHKLQNDDPYAGMRESGESDDLASRLKNGGRHKTKAKGKVTVIKSKKKEKAKPAPRIRIRRIEV